MSKLADLTLQLQPKQSKNNTNLTNNSHIVNNNEQTVNTTSPTLPPLDTNDDVDNNTSINHSNLKLTQTRSNTANKPSPTLSMSSYAGTSTHPNPRARLLLNMPDTPTTLAGREKDPFAANFAPNSSEMRGVYSNHNSQSNSLLGDSGSDWEDEEPTINKPNNKSSKDNKDKDKLRKLHKRKFKSRSYDGSSTPKTPKNGNSNELSRPTSSHAVAQAQDVSRRSSNNGVPSHDKSSKQRWAALKSKIIGNKGAIQPRTGAEVDLVTECMYGMLPAVMLKMALDRDEHETPRIPVFLHHLKIRVSDSIHPLSNTHAMFRIECQYGDSLLRWTIYRELRDFVSLHTHFRVASVRRALEGLPEFPKTSLPYFNLLRREGRAKGKELSKSDFARMQRDSLQNYLIDLIRATMFSSSANRICKFFEFSALTVFLVSKGGSQGKAGYLKILSNNCGRLSDQPSIVSGMKLKRVRAPKWWIVRDDYLVCVEDAHSIQIYDVFLIDNDFSIERPKRYYRQTANAIRAPFVEGEAYLQQHHPHLPGHHHQRQNSQPKDSRSDKNVELYGRPSTTYGREGRENSGDEYGLEQQQQQINENIEMDNVAQNDQIPETYKKNIKNKSKDVSTHTFYIRNGERRLKLVAKNERQMEQFIQSMMMMKNLTQWSKIHRFDSFAPVRLNVSAQWLVDGRDYYWQLSKAISMAQESIYIHDWWLSPELLLRRPGSQKWKLTNLLQRKAKEGVKIYVIVYREVSNEFTPIDSNYAKQTLRSLHENIMVQRSPSHISTGVLYFSHHEKLCVIDQTMVFMGGLDLCFGRWDTPQHIVVDEGIDNDENYIWPGKDYSNARVSDFHSLTKPNEDMFDRKTIPRMPWHDVAMQLIGQPARDLSRHFIQRWNYLLRTKHHSRELPFLLPPADFKPSELECQRMNGSLEMQICRSCGPWSIGTPDKIEHSIQNAYVKAIQKSEHFVYIENQFFVTSTIVNTTVIENQIGDALVNRIIRAHRENEIWRACIIVPLLPGYAEPVDSPDASSVRLIVDCQNKSICRGAHSIFARLRKEGIDPDDYITFFSLRSWGKFKSGNLTTEQLYIHAKTMTVDDRLTIIGSANINERSQRGDRDSEIASVIRDTDMIDSQMAGKPFKVGRFNHTLRVRLMREHLGIDVDDIDMDDNLTSSHKANQRTSNVNGTNDIDNDYQQNNHNGIHESHGSKYWNPEDSNIRTKDDKHDPNLPTSDIEVSEPLDRLQNAIKRSMHELKGEGNEDGSISKKISEDRVKDSYEQNQHQSTPHGSNLGLGIKSRPRGYSSTSSANLSASERQDQRRSRRNTFGRYQTSAYTMPFPGPDFDKDSFIDPISEDFFEDVWIASAIYNTEIYRKVFHCVPDDTVTTWRHLKNFGVMADKHNKPIVDDKDNHTNVERSNSTSSNRVVNGFTSVNNNINTSSNSNNDNSSISPSRHSINRSTNNNRHVSNYNLIENGYTKTEIEMMERLLNQLKGNLVLYPTKFLETEDMSGNFLFNADHLHPLQVYD